MQTLLIDNILVIFLPLFVMSTSLWQYIHSRRSDSSYSRKRGFAFSFGPQSVVVLAFCTNLNWHYMGISHSRRLVLLQLCGDLQ